MNRLRKLFWRTGLLALLLSATVAGPAMAAAEKTSFNVAWSIYVGWMPLDYADQSGILTDAADRARLELTALFFQLGFSQVDFRAK